MIGATEYIPDIAVYPWRKVDYTHGDEIRVEEIPLLIIEILSPTQKALELYDNAQNAYLPAGVPSVWIVQPLAHTVAVLTQRGVTLHHAGRLEDSTGVAVDLDVIFED